MPPQELIDLSLSTDDEAPLRLPPVHRKDVEPKETLDDGFLLLDDDLDSTVNIDESWQAGASKRRKLSSSPKAQRGLEGDQVFLAGIPIRPENEPQWGTAMVIQRGSSVEGSGHIVGTLSLDNDSSHFPGSKSRPELMARINSDSDESLPEDIIHSSIGPTKRGPQLSERTATLLASLNKPAKQNNVREEARIVRGKNPATKNKRLATSGGEEMEPEDVEKPKKTSKKMRLTDAEKATKAEERESLRIAKKQKREKEKENEQERKRLLKEERHREKQKDAALAEVNKSRLDKKLTGPQMIVDLPASIDGHIVDTQIREFLKKLQIDVTSYQSPIPNMIKWRRKVKSRYNEEKGYWEPVEPMEIENELHVLCLMSAREFVALASAQDDHQNGLDVEAHVLQLKGQFEGCKPIYLIEGLNTWMRKNKNTLNRAYQAAMLSQLDSHENSAPGGSQKSTSRRKQPAHEYADADMIEDALLRLQVMNGCLVHHTAIAVETAEWVANFTQHISTIPFRYFFYTSCILLY